MAIPKKLDLFDDKNPDYYYFRVKKEDVYKMLKYQDFISTHLAKGNKIPYRVFKKYFSFFSITDDEKNKFYSSQFEHYKHEILTHFKDDKTYYFDSFEEMIDEVIGGVIHQMLEKPEIRTDKVAFLHLVYGTMKTYLDENMKSKERKKYLDSRIKTIAGYIAYVFGYQISYTAPIDSNGQIFNAVKYIFHKK